MIDMLHNNVIKTRNQNKVDNHLCRYLSSLATENKNKMIVNRIQIL